MKPAMQQPEGNSCTEGFPFRRGFVYSQHKALLN
jgi:hypothetical protein